MNEYKIKKENTKQIFCHPRQMLSIGSPAASTADFNSEQLAIWIDQKSLIRVY